MVRVSDGTIIVDGDQEVAVEELHLGQFNDDLVEIDITVSNNAEHIILRINLHNGGRIRKFSLARRSWGNLGGRSALVDPGSSTLEEILGLTDLLYEGLRHLVDVPGGLTELSNLEGQNRGINARNDATARKASKLFTNQLERDEHSSADSDGETLEPSGLAARNAADIGVEEDVHFNPEFDLHSSGDLILHNRLCLSPIDIRGGNRPIEVVRQVVETALTFLLTFLIDLSTAANLLASLAAIRTANDLPLVRATRAESVGRRQASAISEANGSGALTLNRTTTSTARVTSRTRRRRSNGPVPHIARFAFLRSRDANTEIQIEFEIGRSAFHSSSLLRSIRAANLIRQATAALFDDLVSPSTGPLLILTANTFTQREVGIGGAASLGLLSRVHHLLLRVLARSATDLGD